MYIIVQIRKQRVFTQFPPKKWHECLKLWLVIANRKNTHASEWVDQQSVRYPHNGLLPCHKEEWAADTCMLNKITHCCVQMTSGQVEAGEEGVWLNVTAEERFGGGAFVVFIMTKAPGSCTLPLLRAIHQKGIYMPQHAWVIRHRKEVPEKEDLLQNQRNNQHCASLCNIKVALTVLMVLLFVRENK